MKIMATIEADGNELNLDYRRLMLSFLKNALQKNNPELYNNMYGDGVTKEKNFASDIRMGYVKYLSDCIQLTNNEFVWEIVTPDLLLGIDIYNALLGVRNIDYPAYKGNKIRLKKIRIENHKHYDGNSVLIRFCSGICVRRHIKGEKDKYFFFDEEGFFEQLLCNLKIQLKESGINDLGDFGLEAVEAKRVYSKTFGIIIPNSVGRFRLTGSNELINYLCQAGIGSRRNNAFGMFEIIG